MPGGGVRWVEIVIVNVLAPSLRALVTFAAFIVANPRRADGPESAHAPTKGRVHSNCAAARRPRLSRRLRIPTLATHADQNWVHGVFTRVLCSVGAGDDASWGLTRRWGHFRRGEGEVCRGLEWVGEST